MKSQYSAFDHQTPYYSNRDYPYEISLHLINNPLIATTSHIMLQYQLVRTFMHNYIEKQLLTVYLILYDQKL